MSLLVLEERKHHPTFNSFNLPSLLIFPIIDERHYVYLAQSERFYLISFSLQAVPLRKTKGTFPLNGIILMYCDTKLSTRIVNVMHVNRRLCKNLCMTLHRTKKGVGGSLGMSEGR